MTFGAKINSTQTIFIAIILCYYLINEIFNAAFMDYGLNYQVSI